MSSYYLCNINAPNMQNELSYAVKNLIDGCITVGMERNDGTNINISTGIDWNTPTTVQTSCDNKHVLEYIFDCDETVDVTYTPEHYVKLICKQMNPNLNTDNIRVYFKQNALVTADGTNLIDCLDKVVIKISTGTFGGKTGFYYDSLVVEHHLTEKLAKMRLNDMKDARYSVGWTQNKFSRYDVCC
jgi:hypothetical protein